MQQSNIFTQSSAPFKYIDFAMVEPVVPGTINKYLSHLLINQSLIVRFKGKKKNSVLNTEFSEPEVVNPVSIDTVPSDNYYAIRELVDKFHGVAQPENIYPETSSMVMLSQHTYEVSTTYPRFVYFLDEGTKWDTSIVISSSSYDYKEQIGTFTFDLYSIHQLLPGEVEKDYTKDIIAGGTGKGNANEDPHPEGGK